jgi:ribonuclease III
LFLFYSLEEADIHSFSSDLQIESDDEEEDILPAEYDKKHLEKLWHALKNNFNDVLLTIQKSAPAFELQKIPSIDKSIITLGILEMFYFNKSPKIVINECLEIAKEFKGEDNPKFINGAMFKVFSVFLKLTPEEEEIFGLAHRLGFNFSKRYPLITAFVHRSILNESRHFNESYERLEFLGDSLITKIVSSYLFERYEKENEGELTKTKLNLINGKTLSEVSREIGLSEHIIFGKGIDKAKTDSSSTEDVFESFSAAIFLEFGEETLKKFLVEFLIEPRLEQASSEVNPKTQLQHICQGEFKITPSYRLISHDTLAENSQETFECGVFLGEKQLASAKGSNIKSAEMEAALKAVEILENMPEDHRLALADQQE